MSIETHEADVLLARDGDEAAFGRLVALSANTICSIALAIVRNVAASEDIAQEVFLAAWNSMRSLRNPGSFLPWLRQVARNQAHLWLREHAREIGDDDALTGATDGRLPADEHLIAKEERRLLAEALDQVPDEAREVLVLYYREGSSTRQVALLLGISEEAIRQRLSRSRGLLRQELLERFGSTVLRTAPGTAFAATVAGALTFSASSASAAIAAASAASTPGASGLASAIVAKATLAGGILGWAGVLMGMKNLEPVFDEREGEELRRFRNVALLVVTAGCLAGALSAASFAATLVAVQSLYVVLGYLYIVRLPRILERRMAWEKAVNPELAAQSRRRWMWDTAGRAFGAALAGAVLMATFVKVLAE
ncbi:MAG: sigma-70 family RNA polymerase sigma factor [Acidobacteriota bacterium]